MPLLYSLPAFFFVFGFASINQKIEENQFKINGAPVKGKVARNIKNIIIVFFGAWAIVLVIGMILMALRFFPHPS